MASEAYDVISDLDRDIDRAADLGRKIKKLEAERSALKDGIRAAMQFLGIEKRDSGQHAATLYSQVRTSPDWDYLESILTPEQLERARKTSVSSCLRVV